MSVSKMGIGFETCVGVNDRHLSLLWVEDSISGGGEVGSLCECGFVWLQGLDRLTPLSTIPTQSAAAVSNKWRLAVFFLHICQWRLAVFFLHLFSFSVALEVKNSTDTSVPNFQVCI